MTLIELIFVGLALLTGSLTARYAYSAWGMWGGVGGFVVGTLSFVGVGELLARLLSPTRPRCACGKCGVDDFQIKRDVDGQPTLRVYACGRTYRKGEDRKLYPLSDDSGGVSNETP